ncbi:hypothetical protein HDV02_003724 [Globomyces sp. JEL0801]|nr:hypothetical protein HDV02_003724 [Globomyces sp. JEL0801]
MDKLLSMKLVKEDSLKKRTDFLAIDRKKFDSFAYRFQMGLIGLTTRNMTIIIVCLLLIFNSFIVIMDMNTMIMLSRIILIQFSFHSMIYKSVFNSLLYMKFSKHVRVPDPMKNEEKNFKQQTDLAGAFEINIKQLNIVNEKHTSGRPLSKTSDMGKTTKSRVDMSDKNSMASGYDSKILSTKETVEEN